MEENGYLRRVGGTVPGSFLFFPGPITDDEISGVSGGKSTCIPSGGSRGDVPHVESGDSFARGLRLSSEGRRGASTCVGRTSLPITVHPTVACECPPTSSNFGMGVVPFPS